MGKYQELKDRIDFCDKAYDESNDVKYLMEMDSLLHFFEAGGRENYENIVAFMKRKGFMKAYDIGCAFGHQSQIFVNEGIDYVGINEKLLNFWNMDKFTYIERTYPFFIRSEENAIAVSVLCLTWNCYLYAEDTLDAQLTQLKQDFKHCLLYLAEDKVNEVKKYYANAEEVYEGLYYFYN